MSAGPENILDMACSFYDSAVLFGSLELGIFTVLAESGDNGKDVEGLSAENNLDTRCCRLLLDACVAAGLLEKRNDRYTNTPESNAFLVSGQPAYLGEAVRYNSDVYPAWGNLAELVRTGKPVENPELHLGKDRERTRRFVLSMHGRCMAIGRAVVPMLDLDGKNRLLDVGGGPGTYSALIAGRNPGIHCTVMDLSPIVEIAAGLVNDENIRDRVSFIGGDYHYTPFPGYMDAVLFFGVLHQESAGNIRMLLEKAYNSMKPGGVVYILDMMTDETRTNPGFSAMFAVNMALTTEAGWVFSDSEIKEWLKDAGFDNIKLSMLPPPMPHWLMSACKPDR